MTSKTMKAIAQVEHGDASVLKVHKLPIPTAGPMDIIVANRASGVNPVDYKVRDGEIITAPIDPSLPLILGWDGAGVVHAVGSKVTKFQVGDEVYYSGDVTRAGSYAEYTAVDARVVAKKPKSLSFVQAAAIPLVSITAWELLVETLRVEKGKSVLIYNGAGGVGSVAMQLAKIMGLMVVATASRPETTEWCKKLGADHVINHRSKSSLKEQLEGIGLKDGVDYATHLHDANNAADLVLALKPLGALGFIQPVPSEAMSKIDTVDLFTKRKSLHCVFMFMRTMLDIKPEMQGELLEKVAQFFDDGKMQDIKTKEFGLEQAGEAHALQASGKVHGKIVLTIP